MSSCYSRAVELSAADLHAAVEAAPWAAARASADSLDGLADLILFGTETDLVPIEATFAQLEAEGVARGCNGSQWIDATGAATRFRGRAVFSWYEADGILVVTTTRRGRVNEGLLLDCVDQLLTLAGGRLVGDWLHEEELDDSSVSSQLLEAAGL